MNHPVPVPVFVISYKLMRHVTLSELLLKYWSSNIMVSPTVVSVVVVLNLSPVWSVWLWLLWPVWLWTCHQCGCGCELDTSAVSVVVVVNLWPHHCQCGCDYCGQCGCDHCGQRSCDHSFWVYMSLSLTFTVWISGSSDCDAYLMIVGQCAGQQILPLNILLHELTFSPINKVVSGNF